MSRVARRIATLFLLLSSAVKAQEPLDRWDIGIWIAGATGEEDRDSLTQAQVCIASLYAGRPITEQAGKSFLRGNLEYGFNVIPVFVTSRPHLIYGGGFEPIVLRWNFRRFGRFIPYIELAGGGLFTNSNFPAGNTSNFNFTTRGGGGVHIFAKRRQSWDIGLRFLHISNANLGDKNPQFNGLQVIFGYHWFK
jgi:hypothetical protein